MNNKPTQTTVPKLRFPEFSGDWEEKCLGDVARFSKGKGIAKTDVSIDGITPCIRYAELYTTYGDVITEVVSRTNLDAGNLKLSSGGEVIIPASGETCEDIATASAVLTAGIALGGDLNILSTNENSSFLARYISSVLKSRLAKRAQGNSVVHLYSEHIKPVKITLPPHPDEQAKIAAFLGVVDELIVAEIQKLEALKNHKKGLMQQLFPAEGKTLPNLRFPEFRNNSEWIIKPISRVIQVITPPKKIQGSQYLISGDFPIIDQSKNQIAGWTNNVKAVINEGLPLIVFGDHTCITKISYEPFVQGADGIKIFKGSKELDTCFLFQYLSFAPLATQNYKRHFSTLKAKSVCFPDKKSGEQQKIADCLSSMDDLITAQSKKIKVLQDHKKGLMQQLFPRQNEEVMG